MILQENQRVNSVVRALIFNHDHLHASGYLLATQWRGADHAAFPIGGRVEFGEPLVEALRREVREETGAQVTGFHLVYFAENLFSTQAGIHYHEYGWYFWTKVDRPVCGLDEIVPNPDHPDLVIRYMPVDEPGLANFWPRFLRRYLPADWAQGFDRNPRYIYSRQGESGAFELRELGGLFEA